ncbi:MAG: hypothetical protein ACXW3D_09020 [Caulobacteraceae bacterium]
MTQNRVFVGIDISKAWLDAALSGGEQTIRLANVRLAGASLWAG